MPVNRHGPASCVKVKYKTDDALTGKPLAVGQEALGCPTQYGNWEFTLEPIDPQEFFDFANASEQARNYDPDVEEPGIPPLTQFQAEILKAYASKYPWVAEFIWEYEEATENAT